MTTDLSISEIKAQLKTNAIAGRERWKTQSLTHRLLHLRYTWIPNPTHLHTLRAIDGMIETVEASGESEGLLIVCGAGGGKTSLVRQLALRHPDSEVDGVQLRRVVRMAVPKPATPMRLVSALLRSLGDPGHESGRQKERLERAHFMLRKCRTQVLAIDNFQDVPERRDKDAVRVIGNWFRDVFDDVPLAHVALGTDDARKVREVNDQIRGRYSRVMAIPYFDLASPIGLQAWVNMLKDLDAELPFAETSNLTAGRRAARLHIASNGILRFLCKLLRYSIQHAVKAGRESLMDEDLEHGFLELAGDVAPGGNPFGRGFNGEKLIKADQLFYKMDLQGRDGVNAGAVDKSRRSA